MAVRIFDLIGYCHHHTLLLAIVIIFCIVTVGEWFLILNPTLGDRRHNQQ